jgi:hypothetical protein
MQPNVGIAPCPNDVTASSAGCLLAPSQQSSTSTLSAIDCERAASFHSAGRAGCVNLAPSRSREHRLACAWDIYSRHRFYSRRREKH